MEHSECTGSFIIIRYLVGFSLFGATTPTEEDNLRDTVDKDKPPFHYDWSNLRVEDDRMVRHKGDVRLAHELTRRTLTCKDCGGRKVIEGRVDGVGYCGCPGKEAQSAYGQMTEGVAWTPFLEKKVSWHLTIISL